MFFVNMCNSPVDLLSLLHRTGYSLKESQSGVWFASKTVDGNLVGYFSNDINELYRLCTNQCPILPK